MWTCNLCNRSFSRVNQVHYCGDRTVGEFLYGKTDFAIELFDYFISKFAEIGPIKLHATKSMVIVSAETRAAYIINIGKSFIDIVFSFQQPYDDNLCFRKIALVPGTNDYNHHLRLMLPDDINEEVFDYMKKAYRNGENI